MRRLFVVAAMLMVACGQTPGRTVLSNASPALSATAAPVSATAVASAPRVGTTPSPSAARSPLPQPTTSAALLFAVLEAKGTANPFQWNTVAIAGLDGYARAKATFTPMPSPWVGCAGPVLPLSAQVAAGKVFFADSTGTVRSLSAHGQLAVVATFPMISSQQMLSFAVSPDGTRLLGAVFTIPPKPASGDPCTSGGPMFGPGDFTLDVYVAGNGGGILRVDHEVLPTSSTSSVPNIMALLGWDSIGPLGTYPTAWATQGGGPRHYNGIPVRVDATNGRVGGQISQQGVCDVIDIAATGDFLCLPVVASGAAVDLSVRRPDGSEIWRASQPNADFFLAYMSPDEQRLFALGTTSEALGRDGSVIPVAAAFSFDGWLDSGTVIGGGYNTNLDYVSLSSPNTVVDLGFKGIFIGTVQT